MDGVSRGGDDSPPAGRDWAGRGTKRKLHSRSGCATCRRRRVRCDERRDVCSNCERLGLSCSWYSPAELCQRSRVNTACERCRSKKIRCTSAWSTGPCDPCQSAGTPCINAKKAQRRLSAPSEVRPTSSVAPVHSGSLFERNDLCLPGRAELRGLIEAYFAGPHFYCFYTFIHEPTLLQMFDEDVIPESLLLIVVATSLHFLEPHNPLPDLWADECRRLTMSEIFSPPSTATLQALLLLQRYEWHRASHISAWFLSGLAVRLAHGLQLNVEIMDKARVPATVREIRRRLTWSCFIMESMIEAGRSPLSGIDVSKMEVKVPCNEKSFQLGLETGMPDLNHLLDSRYEAPKSAFHPSLNPVESVSRPGISAFLVKLTALRRDILDYTLPYHPRNKGHIPFEKPWAQDSPFFGYETKLERWRACLPDELVFSADVMYRRRSQLVTFVTLHCLFHGCYCDLYRIGSYVAASHRDRTVEGPSPEAPSPSFLTTCRRGRLQHALAICRVISDSMEYHKSGHDPVVGIGASLALRVLVIERQQEDSAALGLTDETVYSCLDAAVQCGKEIAKRSVPIRDLFCSVCALAEQHGYHVDLSDISSAAAYSSSLRQQQTHERERAASPSLRTYGTFGRIQSSLAIRKDLLAPPASSTWEKESDLFSNYGPGCGRAEQAQPSQPQLRNDMLEMAGQAWGLDPSFLSSDGFSPNDLGMASGWGDGTLNFSMMPSQFDWINQSLGFDFGNFGGPDPTRP